MRVATSESWKDRDGNRQERTEWHRVVIFNENLGRVAKSYLKKGSKVYLEGQIQTRKWQDQSGQDRYSTEVVLQRFRGELVLLDSRGGGGGGGFGGGDDYGDARRQRFRRRPRRASSPSRSPPSTPTSTTTFRSDGPIQRTVADGTASLRACSLSLSPASARERAGFLLALHPGRLERLPRRRARADRGRG